MPPPAGGGRPVSGVAHGAVAREGRSRGFARRMLRLMAKVMQVTRATGWALIAHRLPVARQQVETVVSGPRVLMPQARARCQPCTSRVETGRDRSVREFDVRLRLNSCRSGARARRQRRRWKLLTSGFVPAMSRDSKSTPHACNCRSAQERSRVEQRRIGERRVTVASGSGPCRAPNHTRRAAESIDGAAGGPADLASQSSRNAQRPPSVAGRIGWRTGRK
jgi:hypothetical protein